MAGRKRETEIYVAKTSFACEVDGERLFINQGERVRHGHPLLKDQGEYFELADETVHFDVEQATAAPGEKRGA